jgi:hypothetical protein
VTDPAGETIDWRNTSSASGGFLDRDAYGDCTSDDRPPENIVWDEGAPSGDYIVTVHVYALCGESSTGFVLTIRVGGQVILVVDDVVLSEVDETYTAEFTVP